MAAETQESLEENTQGNGNTMNAGGAQCQLPAMDWWLHLMCIFAEAQRHSIPFKEELNGLLSTLSDTGDTIERWFKVR